jgi:hypothetical protein
LRLPPAQEGDDEVAQTNVSAPEREIQCLRGVACCKKVLLY